MSGTSGVIIWHLMTEVKGHSSKEMCTVFKENIVMYFTDYRLY